MAGDIQLNVSAAEIDSAVLDHKNSTIAASKSSVNTTGFTDNTLTNLQLVAAAVDENQTNLNSTLDQYELIQYYQSIPSGTSGTVTIPTGYAVELDRFGGDIDAVITKTGVDGRPIDEVVRNAAGDILTTTFSNLGAYVLSGTPIEYPIAIIFYLKGKTQYRGNLTFDYITGDTVKIQLSNEYDGNSTVVAVTEKALSDGLASIRTTLTDSITFTNNLSYTTKAIANTSAKENDRVIITPTNNLEESAFIGLNLGVVSITPGVGYTIYGATMYSITNSLTINIQLIIS